MFNTQQLKLLERLRDDCDILISALIGDEASPAISYRTVDRVMKLLKQPRHLFDAADGWPPLEEVAAALRLERPIINELASLLARLGEPSLTRSPRERSRVSEPAEQTRAETIAELRNGLAETTFWHARKWLDQRIATMTAVSKDSPPRVTGSLPRSRPPQLRRLGDGPSLGFRPVGEVRSSITDAALLERANQAHEDALQAVKRLLAAQGVECFQSPLIDLACVLNGTPQIIEAKSITPDNEVEQIRAAYAQLHDYRFRYRDEAPFAGAEVSLWTVLSDAPSDSWTRDFLRSSDIRLIWLNHNGELAGPDLAALRPLHSMRTRKLCL